MSVLHTDNSLTPSNLVVRTKPRQDDNDEEELPIHSPTTIVTSRVATTSHHHHSHSSEEEHLEFKATSPSSTRNNHHHLLLRKEASNVQIGMAISFFSITSILSVFLTKYLMDMGEYAFHFPLTMAWFHLIVSLLCIICTYNLNRTCFTFLPDFEFKFDTAVQIAPISLCYVGMVTFNNLCLDYADIHTYHTARSISICFTVIFTSLLLGEKVQKRIIGACLMIAIGYFMTGFEELQISKMQSIGFAFGLMSSCFMALYSIYLKKFMSSSHRNHWIILIYNVVCAILFLFPVCYFTGEFEKAISVNYLFEPKFLAILTTTALIAYIVNISNFMLISYTSPLTTSVTISMKSVVESFLSYALHNTHVSTYGLLSSAFTVVGTYLYSYFKVKDKREFEGLVD